MTERAKKRLDLARKIDVYRKRLEILKEKYPEKSIDFRYLSRNLITKLELWKKEVAGMDNKKKILRDIDKKALEFFGFSFENIGRKKDKRKPGTKKEEKVATQIFCKYVLESGNGVNGKELAHFLGYKNRQTATVGRKNVTKSFQDIPENKDLFNRFKNYSISL